MKKFKKVLARITLIILSSIIVYFSFFVPLHEIYLSGGLKEVSARDMFAKDPTSLIMKSVKGMLPKNKLNRSVLKKLRIYKGSEHPHAAQMNTIPATAA